MFVRLASILAFTALFSSPPLSAEAGPWTQPKGEYYLKLWNRTLVGRQIFVSERTTARLPENYQDHQLNVFAEYGLSNDLTLTLLGSPVGFAGFGDERRFYSGGAAAGVRYQLTGGALKTAVEVQVGGRPDSGSLGSGMVEVQREDRIEMDEFDAVPSVGAAHGTLELSVGYGLPFFWWTASTGLRAFTNSQLKPAYYLNGQIGWISDFDLVLDVHVSWYYSAGDIGPINVYGAGQTRYLGLGLGASYWLTDHFAINAGFDGAFFATANAATPSFIVGVEFK